MRIRQRRPPQNPLASPADPGDGCTEHCCCFCCPSPENPTSSNQPNPPRSPTLAEEGEQALSAPVGSGVFSSSSSSSTASRQDETDSSVGAWRGHHRTKCRTRSTIWGANTDRYFGSQKPSARGVGKSSRKNNPHWTDEEVIMLVEGVSKYGIGRWTEIKNIYFTNTCRTAVHLKDKWKNLKAACGPEVRSKKKVKAQKATKELIDRLEAQIIEICAAEKKKSLDEINCAAPAAF